MAASLKGGNVDQITELHNGGESRFAMAQANGGAAGVNGELPQVDGAVPHEERDGTLVHGTGQAEAPVAGLPVRVAPVAGALIPQGLVPARFDVDGVLLGPLPTKSNENCKIFPKIVEETGP